jgi:hypothetical protein
LRVGNVVIMEWHVAVTETAALRHIEDGSRDVANQEDLVAMRGASVESTLSPIAPSSMAKVVE